MYLLHPSGRPSQNRESTKHRAGVRLSGDREQWDLRAVASAAGGRLIHGDVDLPGVGGLIPTTIAAAYCPPGGTTTNRPKAWLAQERILAAAGLALIDRCRRLGRVLLLGMDANAIASSLATVISKSFGARNTTNASVLDRCPTFVAKEKSSSSSKVVDLFR